MRVLGESEINNIPVEALKGLSPYIVEGKNFQIVEVTRKDGVKDYLVAVED